MKAPAASTLYIGLYKNTVLDEIGALGRTLRGACPQNQASRLVDPAFPLPPTPLLVASHSSMFRSQTFPYLDNHGEVHVPTNNPMVYLTPVITPPLLTPLQTQLKHTSILILGAGWTSTFLIPLLEARQISHAATSTTGRPGTLPFKFDPSSPSLEPYHFLPSANTILITFPLKGPHQSTHLLSLYRDSHPDATPNWIQLGSTGIFQIADQELWVTRHSTYDRENARAVAEDELLALGGCVLNLSGLWGGTRQPRDFVKRVVASKEQLKGKSSLHMVHGMDVARAVVALHERFTKGERWMLTDMLVYDWWALILGWGERGSKGKDEDAEGPLLGWVRELMVEEDVRALPRSMELLGRCYDTREFWSTFGIAPVRARL